MDKGEKFIIKAKNKFGDMYNYDSVNYYNSTTVIKLYCNKHDLFFNQSPVDHLRGRNGCNLCSSNPKVDTNFFIEKAKKIHGDKYNYNKSKYIDALTKVIITCPEHGDFEQLPNNHYKQNCPSCQLIIKNKDKILTNHEFIEQSSLKHKNKYNYSLTDYKNSKTRVIITCPEHGNFTQLPASHLYGKGCKKCSVNNTKKILTSNIGEFLIKARKIHGDKYNYDKSIYINSQIKIKISCPEHGDFEQLPYDHLSNHGCLKCGLSYDKSELELVEFIKSLNLDFEHNTRKIIPPLELDIYIPSKNIAIEYNGLYWHSEEFKDKNYHLNKTEECEKLAIQLIHIFEDEWLYKQDIVKSRLKNILGFTTIRIFARKTEIKLVSSDIAKSFLDSNHIQGNVNSSIRLGLYYNNELVSLMVFNKPRLGIGTFYDGYELSRFCNKLNCSVIGGANKLLKHFSRIYQPKQIVSYADRRWSVGNLYEQLGFKKSNINKPNYSYIIGLKRKHRFGFRKEILKKTGFDTSNKTEHEIMSERKIYRIYDSGTITYKKTQD